MTHVFVAGSRTVSRLNAQIRERLDNIMNQHLAVLIGDANGADKAVQQYLAKSHYRNVVIYSMDVCRNNLGQWPVRQHSAESSRRDRHYYGIKDLAMANDAECGLMLWDGKSKGTLTNVVNLITAGKSTLLYLSPKEQFLKVRTWQDLDQVLSGSGVRDVAQFWASRGTDNTPQRKLKLVVSG